MSYEGTAPLSGHLGLKRIRPARPSLAWRLRNARHVFSGWWRHQLASTLGVGHLYSRLELRLVRGDGTVVDYGTVSRRVVTTAGVTEVCTRFAGTSAASIANFKFHGFGTGTGVEGASDTTLGTELTTEYASDIRPTGSQSASGVTYITAATLSPDSGGTLAITEHGIFAAVSTGTLLDRSKFSAVNLVASSDSLLATYTLTIAAGG